MDVSVDSMRYLQFSESLCAIEILTGEMYWSNVLKSRMMMKFVLLWRVIFVVHLLF